MNDSVKRRAPLARNFISYIGWAIALVAFIIGVILIIADFVLKQSNPYNALVTYMIIPLIIGFGIFIGFIGIYREARYRRKHVGEAHVLPSINLNDVKTRKRVIWGMVILTVFFSVSAVGTYRGFVFTESTEFCGEVCHQIMEPEFTAYQHSPHARVACVECHIGAGAEWYARSKVSGLRQVWRTAVGTYNLPIDVPIHNLRPARETCEECHWPEKFVGSMELVQWHFWYDEDNTPSRYNILMKVGGQVRATGEAEGIHWHTSSKEIVRYWPKSWDRQEIPWVEVLHADGTKTVYRGEGAPDGRPPEDEIRTMDCIDCHNRPSHIYRAPYTMINAQLAAGTIDRKLPSVKMNADEILNAEYKTKDEALAGIDSKMREIYLGGADKDADPELVSSVTQAIKNLQQDYVISHFPEQKIDWRTYPNNIGHLNFPGCFRCHNHQHQSEDGKTITMDCNTCHEFIAQAQGKDTEKPVKYETGEFQHPGGYEDIYIGSMCTDCHSPDLSLY